MNGFIYAIEAAGRVKIGFSENPAKRFSKIASDSPFPCRMLGFWPGTVSEEGDVQDRFKHLRSHGEWFEAHDSILVFIEEMSVAMASEAAEGKRYAPCDDDSVLLAWRKSQRMPAKGFADAVGVTKATWCRWETGALRIPASKLIEIERVTGISRHELRPDLSRIFVDRSDAPTSQGERA